jgi:hypothetical protein
METLKITSNKNPITIIFPAGAGGNWVASTIDFLNNNDLEHNLVNFHNFKSSQVRLTHSFDTNEVGYVLSGKTIFNFYLNLLHKLYHYQFSIRNKDYCTWSMKYFEVSTHSFDFINVDRKVDLSFDDLIDNDIKFYNKIIDIQQVHNLTTIPFDEFLYRKSKFFKTCVNPKPVFKNFDDPVWVFFLLGILDRINIRPHGSEHFYMFEEKDFNKAKNFVLKHFHNVPEIEYYEFDTDVFLTA